jgi:protein associated with RNAse G/E
MWIVRRKWPDSPHYEMSGVVLGDDEYGTWLGSKAGTPVRTPSGEERTGDYSAVFCVPRDDWYFVHFWVGHPEVEIYVDICAPAEWATDKVSMVDLDFDVIRWNAAKGGHVQLVDEDEFEEHRVSLAYPDDLEANARRAAQDVLGRATRGEPPFNLDCAAPWLTALERSG